MQRPQDGRPLPPFWRLEPTTTPATRRPCAVCRAQRASNSNWKLAPRTIRSKPRPIRSPTKSCKPRPRGSIENAPSAKKKTRRTATEGSWPCAGRRSSHRALGLDSPGTPLDPSRAGVGARTRRYASANVSRCRRSDATRRPHGRHGAVSAGESMRHSDAAMLAILGVAPERG
jgi:hypothetical protein